MQPTTDLLNIVLQSSRPSWMHHLKISQAIRDQHPQEQVIKSLFYPIIPLPQFSMSTVNYTFHTILGLRKDLPLQFSKSPLPNTSCCPPIFTSLKLLFITPQDSHSKLKT